MFFSALIFSAFLELGGMFGGMYNYPVAEPIVEIPIYTTMSAEVEFNGLYVGGEMKCYFLAEAVTNYTPFQNTYIFRAGYRVGGVTIGYERSCFHPMQTYMLIDGDEWKPRFEGAVNKYFVRIETK